MMPLPYELYAGIMAVLLIGASVLLVLAWHQRETPAERRYRDLPPVDYDRRWR